MWFSTCSPSCMCVTSITSASMAAHDIPSSGCGSSRISVSPSIVRKMFISSNTLTIFLLSVCILKIFCSSKILDPSCDLAADPPRKAAVYNVRNYRRPSQRDQNIDDNYKAQADRFHVSHVYPFRSARLRAYSARLRNSSFPSSKRVS